METAYGKRIESAANAASADSIRTFRVLMVAPTSFFADYGCHVRILEAGQRFDSNVGERRVLDEHGPAKRLIREERCLVQLEHAIVRHIERLAALLRHDAFFLLEIVVVPMRRGQDVGDEVEHERSVLAQHARIYSPSQCPPRGIATLQLAGRF